MADLMRFRRIEIRCRIKGLVLEKAELNKQFEASHKFYLRERHEDILKEMSSIQSRIALISRDIRRWNLTYAMENGKTREEVERSSVGIDYLCSVYTAQIENVWLSTGNLTVNQVMEVYGKCFPQTFKEAAKDHDATILQALAAEIAKAETAGDVVQLSRSRIQGYTMYNLHSPENVDRARMLFAKAILDRKENAKND